MIECEKKRKKEKELQINEAKLKNMNEEVKMEKILMKKMKMSKTEWKAMEKRKINEGMSKWNRVSGKKENKCKRVVNE